VVDELGTLGSMEELGMIEDEGIESLESMEETDVIGVESLGSMEEVVLSVDIAVG